MDDDVPVLISGGSLVGLSTALFLGWHGVPSLVVERHPGTAIHPRAALVNQRTIELYRGVGLEAGDPRSVGARVRPERCHRVGRVPGRPRARVLLPEHQRGRRAPEPVAARVHHADRPGADSREARHRARRAGRVGHRADLLRGRRRRCHGHRPGTGERQRANGARPVPRRRGREPQPCAGASRDPAARARELLEQHHDLLPRRHPPAGGGPKPERDLRLRTRPAGLLPLLEGGGRRFPGRQQGARRDRGADERPVG